jgi:purine nucleosidase
VIAGCARPLMRENFEAADIHGEDGLGGLALPEPARQALAIDATAWMADGLMRRPEHTVRILALGPLTNLARLVESHPDAARRVAGIVAMGGAVQEGGNVTRYAEFNIAADPEAAAIVLGAGVPVTLVPLDVTRKVLADRAWSASLVARGGGIARTANALIESYLRNLARRRSVKGAPAAQALPPSFPLHDPCVILHAIDPGLFRAEPLPIRVVADRSERDGQTVIDQEAGAIIHVLTHADSARALAVVLDRLAALP